MNKGNQNLLTLHKDRKTYLDYLWGFIFILLAFDHASHAYAKLWGGHHFFTMDIADRSLLFDYVYLSTNNIIMPMLFFLFGVWLVPSINDKGAATYIKDRMTRYGVVFVLFIPTILPLMTYPRYVIERHNNALDFIAYYTDFFFTNHLQAGPMWVMYGVILFSIIAVAIYRFIPNCFAPTEILYKYCIKKPYQALLILILIIFTIFTTSEILWGPYYWIGFAKLFYLQGSKFIVQFLFFWLGVFLGSKGVLFNKEIMDKVSLKLYYYIVAMIIFGFLYLNYSTVNHDIAYSYDLLIYIKGTTSSSLVDEKSLEIVKNITPGIAVRTLLQSLYLSTQFLTLISIFYKLFHNKNNEFWTKLAQNAYGIFIFHDVISIWMQYAYYSISTAPLLEVISIFVISVSASWIITEKLRKSSNLIKRVIQ